MLIGICILFHIVYIYQTINHTVYLKYVHFIFVSYPSVKLEKPLKYKKKKSVLPHSSGPLGIEIYFYPDFHLGC